MSVRLGAPRPPTGRDTELAASGRTITFPGFLRAYVEGADDPDAELDDRETPAAARWPRATRCPTPELEAKGHTTSPPARFTEASLVKRLEELGIGRPSTYASIMQTIQDRGYVWKKGTALVPTWTAFAVVNLLEQHFTDLVDYAFTARMEDDLDEIAGGDVRARARGCTAFWFGHGGDGRRRRTASRLGLKELVDAASTTSTPPRSTRSRSALDADGELDRGQARPLRPVREAGRGHRVGPRRPRRPTSSPSTRPSSCSPPPRATASSASTPTPG